MAKTKKTEAAVPETAPELEIPQDPYQELMEPDPVEEPEPVETAPEEPEPVETAPIEYAVTGCEVATGWLTGWVMAQYLEPVWS